MAGIDKSDFHPPGRPQLSSTVGPHLDGAASLTGSEHHSVQGKTAASPSVSVCEAMIRNVCLCVAFLRLVREYPQEFTCCYCWLKDELPNSTLQTCPLSCKTSSWKGAFVWLKHFVSLCTSGHSILALCPTSWWWDTEQRWVEIEFRSHRLPIKHCFQWISVPTCKPWAGGTVNRGFAASDNQLIISLIYFIVQQQTL